ncbi:MAG: cysteine synthase A [Syntrophobacterales bacterium]|nr:MAG: cysteine synthase A [Syntrophobacterales bacterium]
MAIANSLSETVGNTPLLRLTRITQGIEPLIAAKCEFISPSGSLKDRILVHMVESAERNGGLRPDMTIIEGSTGNTGIATAMVAAAKGYRCIIVMPEGMSLERRKAIQAYGAELILTPGGESDVDLVLKKVKELIGSNPGRFWEAGQFTNEDNPRAHYESTGLEIWEQTEGRIDTFVAAVGSGGTLTGAGRYLKERNPKIKIFAAEPQECPTLSERRWGFHKIEGIGDGFIPRVFDVSILDGVVITTTQESIEMARRLAREEGLFVGISSGCNVAAAIKVAVKYTEAKLITTILPDHGFRYFSSELCGVEASFEIPERDHPLDDYTTCMLDRYQGKWEIIR